MRRWAIGAGALVALAALWFVGPIIVRKLPVFRVRRVEVLGSRYLEPTAVVKALGLGQATSIFTPKGPLERNAIRVPGLLRARISSRLPGTLVVSIEERVPVALALINRRLVLIDRRARELPFDPARGASDLPIAVPDTAVLGVLERVRDVDPALYGDIIGARRDRGTVILETGSRRLLFRIGASTREIQGLAVVISEATKHRMPVNEFDARFEGRVIVRQERRT